MSDYAVYGNAEWLVKVGFRDIFKDNVDVQAITNNVRVSSDVTAARSMPGLAINCICDQSVQGTNEYHCRLMFICETHVNEDKDGQIVDAVLGIVRDIIHMDPIPGSPPGTIGIVQAFNKLVRGFVIQDQGWKEGIMDPDDEGDIRRRILQADAWGYVGRKS